MTSKRSRKPQGPIWADVARYLALALLVGLLELQGVHVAPTQELDAHFVGATP